MVSVFIFSARNGILSTLKPFVGEVTNGKRARIRLQQGSALFFSEDLSETGAAKFVLREAIDHFISAYNEQAAPL